MQQLQCIIYGCLKHSFMYVYVFLLLTNYLEQFRTADLCITDAHSFFLSYIS